MKESEQRPAGADLLIEPQPPCTGRSEPTGPRGGQAITLSPVSANGARAIVGISVSVSRSGASLSGLVDIHAHLLPGIDDGPRDLESALEMARAAVDAGIEVIAATPHLRRDFPDVHIEELAERRDTSGSPQTRSDPAGGDRRRGDVARLGARG